MVSVGIDCDAAWRVSFSFSFEIGFASCNVHI